MVICGNKKKKDDKPTEEKKAEEDKKEDELLAKSQPPQPRNIKVRFILGDESLVIHNDIYQSNLALLTIFEDFKSKLIPFAEYDMLNVNNAYEDITAMRDKSLDELFPEWNEENEVVIQLAYAGLDIPLDVKKEYIKQTNYLATPKYETEPFEVIIFDKNTSMIAYNYYKTSDHQELKVLNYFSAYCNGRNKLFISGGDKSQGVYGGDETTYVNTFIMIDLTKQNEIKRLPNLTVGRCWHSMIYVPNKYVFIVGGINTKAVEVYNLETNETTIDSELNEARSESTLCLVNNAHLYAFCGYLYHSNFLNTIERCNLRTKVRMWEYVSFSTSEGCIFEPSFFAVTYHKDNTIILLGGNEQGNIANENRTKNRNYLFDPMSNTFENYNLPPLEDLCSEKFFIPISDKASILMPIYTSESIKILHFSDGNLDIIKFEEHNPDTTLDEIRNSLTVNEKGERKNRNPPFDSGANDEVPQL
jgi:hypothetical protein